MCRDSYSHTLNWQAQCVVSHSSQDMHAPVFILCMCLKPWLWARQSHVRKRLRWGKKHSGEYGWQGLLLSGPCNYVVLRTVAFIIISSCWEYSLVSQTIATCSSCCQFKMELLRINARLSFCAESASYKKKKSLQCQIVQTQCRSFRTSTTGNMFWIAIFAGKHWSQL